MLTGTGVPAVRDGAQGPTWGFLEVGRAVPECSLAHSQPSWALWVAWVPSGRGLSHVPCICCRTLCPPVAQERRCCRLALGPAVLLRDKAPP